MADNNNILPSNDPDLILAKRIGEQLPDIQALNTEEDPLLKDLFSYKRSIEESNLEPIDSVAIWDSIENSIKESASNTVKGKILSFTPAVRRFAIAASILIAALIGSFLLQEETQPTLIGESYASITEVSLTDGSIIKLRPHSKVFMIKESTTEMALKLEGEAYFDVTSNPERIFSVETEQSKVQVLGTRFVFSEWGNTSNVYLEEGLIRFESLNSGNSVVLEPGQSSKIDDTTLSPVISQKNPQIFTDWMSNELVFNNDRVGDIFNELEHHFNIQIQSSESVKNETLSGSIQLGQIDAVLRDFELVLGGSFTEIDRNSYKFNADS